LNSGWLRWKASFDSRKNTYSRISGAYPIQHRQYTRPTRPSHSGQTRSPQHADYHTSNPVTSNTAHQAIDPIGMLLRLAHYNGVAFLENLVDRDEGLERLDLVGENRLPTMRKHRSVPDIPVCPFSISGVSHTLSCLPKRPPTTCGPTCTRYSCEHVSLQESMSVESTAEISMAQIGVPRKEQWVAIRTYVWARFPLSRVKWLAPVPLLSRAGTAGRALTDAGGLADINGQIGLRPARLRLFGCSRWFGGLWQCPAYRLMVAAMRVQGNRSTKQSTTEESGQRGKSPDTKR
jgi:hypothetical protein